MRSWAEHLTFGVSPVSRAPLKKQPLISRKTVPLIFDNTAVSDRRKRVVAGRAARSSCPRPSTATYRRSFIGTTNLGTVSRHSVRSNRKGKHHGK